jgi:hypothetical protein
VPLPAFRRNTAGDVLCSHDGCDQVATWQTTVDCTGCADVVAEAEQTVAVLADEVDQQFAEAEQAAALVTSILLDAGDERRPLGREETDQVVQAQAVVDAARRAAAVAVAGQRAAQQQVALHSEPHTHPLFGCDAHPQEA